MKQRKGWGMSCDVGNATEGLENELWRRWSDGNVGELAELSTIQWAELILQPFRHSTYVTAPTSEHLRHSSFSNPSVALPTSQLILQPFRSFTYVTVHSPTLLSFLLRHKLFTWRAAHVAIDKRLELQNCTWSMSMWFQYGVKPPCAAIRVWLPSKRSRVRFPAIP